MSPARPRPIPADQSKQELLHEIIRVDHAGEYGAQRIYQGQIAVLKDDDCAPLLQHMAEQEQEHLSRFEDLMTQHKTRPTALMPFWHVAGYALGAGTALMGKRAAMACTVAVESVIAEHYAQQLETLDKTQDKELHDTITRFREEELEHHDIGLEQEAEQAPGYELLSAVIRTGCKAAIALSKKI